MRDRNARIVLSGPHISETRQESVDFLRRADYRSGTELQMACELPHTCGSIHHISLGIEVLVAMETSLNQARMNIFQKPARFGTPATTSTHDR